MELKTILNKFDNLKNTKNNQYTALCPIHGDTENSLMLKYDFENRRVIVNCRAGCDFNQIIKEVELKKKDLFTEIIITAQYHYYDEQGDYKYTRIRYNNKSFKIDGYHKNDKILYNVQELLNRPNDVIYFVEGEKDVENLKKLGLLATTCGGANDWENKFTKYFIDREVVLIGDNDEAGKNLVNIVSKSISPVTKKLDIKYSPVGKDITDFIENYSGNDITTAIMNITSNDKELVFEVSKKGNYLNTHENFNRILKYLGWKVFYDIIKKVIYVETPNSTTELNDTHLSTIVSNYAKHNINFGKDKIMLNIKGEDVREIRNPVLEYLKENENNDETDYIKEMYKCLKLKNETELSYKLFKYWVLQTAIIATNTEGRLKAENVLVLQGEQGLYKTTFVNNLCPNPAWIKDGVTLNPADKDSVYKASTFWVVELGELDSTMKNEQSKLKQFLSEKYDKIRLPYDVTPTCLYRTTSFIGTVNKEAFLKDETGGRRWWILEIAEIDLEAQKKIQLDRFWGQAYYRAQRERYYLDREETLLLNKQNQKYNPRERAVIEFIDEEYSDFDGVINRKISTKDLYLKFTNDTGISINNKDFGKLIKKLYNVDTKLIRINNEVVRIYENL